MEPSCMQGDAHKPNRRASPGVGGTGLKCLDSDAGSSKEQEDEEEGIVVSVKHLVQSVGELEEQLQGVGAMHRALEKDLSGLRQLDGANAGAAERAGDAVRATRLPQSFQEVDERMENIEMLQRDPRPAVQIGPSEADQLDKEIGGGAEKARAEESPEVLQLLSHADMVHYLDVTSGWDEDLCACCFERAVSQRARRALGMKNLEDLRRHLRKQQPRSIPAATPEQQQHNQAAFESSEGTSVQELRREGHRIYPQAQCVSQPGRAPRLCAEAMLLEWMAEPRVGVLMDLGRAHLVSYSSAWPEIVAQLGARRQREGDNFASMLVQVLGVKERAELKEGFGLFVQHVLSGGLEKAHAEGRGGAGRETAEEVYEEGRQGEKVAGSEIEIDSVDSKCGRDRKDLKWREHMKGRVWERYVYGMASILEHGGEEGKAATAWLRLYGSDFISARSCFKDSPQGKVLPMRHPLRDLPSLLVRFGAVPEPLDGSSHLPEWEEWPGGDEAAVKFPDNSSGRCFGLGTAEGRRCRRSRGHAAAGAGPSKGVSLGVEARPMVRCRGDVEGIVDFAAVLFVPPACAHCCRCITIYTSHVPVIAFIATYAYRPAAALVHRFASVFPPHMREYRNIFDGLRLRAPYGSVRALQQAVEQVPILFLLTLALHHSKDLLPQCAADGEQSSEAGGGSNGAKDKAGRRRAGKRNSGEGGEGGESGRGEGDCGDVWEEVQSWFEVAMLPAAGPEAGRSACRGSEAREYGTPAHAERVMQASEWSAVPRFCEDMTHVAGPVLARASMCSKRKGKKGEEAAYLKPWPGGAEGGGVKLRRCSGCGKVAYCSRECQKAHWPSHKLTCPGRASGKKGGKVSGRVSGKASGWREILDAAERFAFFS
ncbi:unnamed protein product [Closterium sp. Naga37s-1]|nr:unnamed protein product [Closterium sp. Naga37s-1]